MWWMIAIYVLGGGVTLGFLAALVASDGSRGTPWLLLAVLVWPVFWVAALSVGLWKGIIK
ncbi:MAG: hypothetical protein BGP11_08275 [Rhodobacterales bacterium 65-51]|uniref:hypothetical protein n=1 Tax=uncultured Gemmobacter sp. TaxID=1095917 RepID=UPI00095FDCE6|nr:hypothetical protein [uncultured Gemmobacter sp.]OJY36335.1 MAG: hypothetical protein BGP11_08275 [Rhodobacterales bacterium 65-51]